MEETSSFTLEVNTHKVSKGVILDIRNTMHFFSRFRYSWRCLCFLFWFLFNWKSSTAKGVRIPCFNSILNDNNPMRVHDGLLLVDCHALQVNKEDWLIWTPLHYHRIRRLAGRILLILQHRRNWFHLLLLIGCPMKSRDEKDVMKGT